jgi:hypothetical protein
MILLLQMAEFQENNLTNGTSDERQEVKGECMRERGKGTGRGEKGPEAMGQTRRIFIVFLCPCPAGEAEAT